MTTSLPGEVRLIARRSVGEDALQQLQNDPELPADTRERFRGVDAPDRDQMIGTAVAMLWRAQQRLLEGMRRPPADDEPEQNESSAT